jgi:hypothetical protein
VPKFCQGLKCIHAHSTAVVYTTLYVDVVARRADGEACQSQDTAPPPLSWAGVMLGVAVLMIAWSSSAMWWGARKLPADPAAAEIEARAAPEQRQTPQEWLLVRGHPDEKFDGKYTRQREFPNASCMQRSQWTLRTDVTTQPATVYALRLLRNTMNHVRQWARSTARSFSRTGTASSCTTTARPTVPPPPGTWMTECSKPWRSQPAAVWTSPWRTGEQEAFPFQYRL